MAPCWNISLFYAPYKAENMNLLKIGCSWQCARSYYNAAVTFQLSAATASLTFYRQYCKVLGYKPAVDCRCSEFRFFVTDSYESVWARGAGESAPFTLLLLQDGSQLGQAVTFPASVLCGMRLLQQFSVLWFGMVFCILWETDFYVFHTFSVYVAQYIFIPAIS